jgi:hypothetical protein
MSPFQFEPVRGTAGLQLSAALCCEFEMPFGLAVEIADLDWYDDVKIARIGNHEFLIAGDSPELHERNFFMLGIGAAVIRGVNNLEGINLAATNVLDYAKWYNSNMLPDNKRAFRIIEEGPGRDHPPQVILNADGGFTIYAFMVHEDFLYGCELSVSADGTIKMEQDWSIGPYGNQRVH